MQTAAYPEAPNLSLETTALLRFLSILGMLAGSSSWIVSTFWALHQPERRGWAALEAYLLGASEVEAWLLAQLMSGAYWYPRLSGETLIRAAASFAGLPESLLKRSCRETGDTAEALSLIMAPSHRAPTGFPEDFATWLLTTLPMHLLSEERIIAYLNSLWPSLSLLEVFFLHKVVLNSTHLPALRLSSLQGSVLSSPIPVFIEQRWGFPAAIVPKLLRSYRTPPSEPAILSLF